MFPRLLRCCSRTPAINGERALITPLLLVAALFALPRNARAQICPSGTICLLECRTNDAAVQDTTEYAYIRGCGIVTLTAGYDLRQGTIHSSAATPGCISGTYTPSAQDNDLFQILGPLPGTPMSFTVELHLHVILFTPAGIYLEQWQASLTEGDSNTDSQGGSLRQGYEELYPVLRVTVDHPAGTPFKLACQVVSTVPDFDAGSSVSGTIVFPDLPPGAVASSCHGYGGGPTPARPVSWGALKVRYR